MCARTCATSSATSARERSRRSGSPRWTPASRGWPSSARRLRTCSSNASGRTFERSCAASRPRCPLASAAVDVGVGLLGYGTVGSAVDRLLVENADDIERATGHRLRVVRALVRDPGKERAFQPQPGVLTSDPALIRGDPSIGLVAEVMGGIEPAGSYVLELLASGKPVVTANKQLVAQRGAELFAAAAAAGVQLRFEASVCAAIPVIKVLREALVVTNVHRVLGIVNGTTNFILTEMERGASFDEALAEAQRRGFAEADPSDDITGADAAAKMAILA